ncbi:hypothetical protein AB6846_11770 [Serratia proteamaculans]
MFINTRKVIVAASLLAVLFSMNALSSATASESLAPRLSDTANMLKSNRELINKFYDAFKTGDKAIILSYITDDFIMHVPGKGLNAGEYWGKRGVQPIPFEYWKLFWWRLFLIGTQPGD